SIYILTKIHIITAHRQYIIAHGTIVNNCKRVAGLCQKEVKKKVAQIAKQGREAPQRAKKLARDMTVWWRKFDKEDRESKKKRDAEERKKRKEEEEIREANRQQRKL